MASIISIKGIRSCWLGCRCTHVSRQPLPQPGARIRSRSFPCPRADRKRWRRADGSTSGTHVSQSMQSMQSMQAYVAPGARVRSHRQLNCDPIDPIAIVSWFRSRQSKLVQIPQASQGSPAPIACWFRSRMPHRDPQLPSHVGAARLSRADDMWHHWHPPPPVGHRWGDARVRVPMRVVSVEYCMHSQVGGTSGGGSCGRSCGGSGGGSGGRQGGAHG